MIEVLSQNEHRAYLAQGSLYHQVERILSHVERPSRYIGGEWGSIEPNVHASYRACLIYPDTYECGLPNQAIAILYQVLNNMDDVSCERAYTPWIDMSAIMREEGIPLYSLESFSPVSSFDMIGITLPHELAVTNILETINLIGLPLFAAERGEDDPLIFAGGPCVYNPEPLAAFIDVFVVGEGEHILPRVVREHRACIEANLNREETLDHLARVDGVYIPSRYESVPAQSYDLPSWAKPCNDQVPNEIDRQVVGDFHQTSPLAATIVPYTEVVHDRLTIEVLRGCARNCRFCQAGMVYLPVRERDADQIVQAAMEGLARTGYDEISLTSLSTTDHSQLKSILHRLNERLQGTDVSISIPSQRLDSFGLEMAELVAGQKRGGLTFAPEAGSQRLRDVINKNVTEQDLHTTLLAAMEAGWRRIKLYFMIGLPTETDEDVLSIAHMAISAFELMRDSVAPSQRGGIGLNLSIAVMVPKASTPFQWDGQLPSQDVKRRQSLLIDALKPYRGINLSYHDAESSQIEALLSRGGREVSAVIHRAWQLGARFDAWSEQFDITIWEQAALDVGFDIEKSVTTAYSLNAHLPWDHINSGVNKSYLKVQRRRAEREEITGDCTFDGCTGCAVCFEFNVDNRIVTGGRRE